MRRLLHENYRPCRRNVREVFVVRDIGFSGHDETVILRVWSMRDIDEDHGADGCDEAVVASVAGGDGCNIAEETGGGDVEFQEGVGDVAGGV